MNEKQQERERVIKALEDYKEKLKKVNPNRKEVYIKVNTYTWVLKKNKHGK